MASGLYDKGREGFLDGSIDWDTDNIKVLLVDTADYTVNLATHENHDDITGAGIVDTSGNLASKTVTAGVADAADITYTAVSGDSCECLVVYKDTGTSATSRLIAYIDGISVTPNGGDITVTWDSGANKIFKL